MEEIAQKIQDYYELVHKASLIDFKAAQYLRYEAPNLPYFVYSKRLITAFTWDYTPQGRMFWKHMHTQLEQLELQNARK